MSADPAAVEGRPVDERELIRRRLSPWPKAALRIAFGVVWAIDAALKWLPGFRADYLDALQEGWAGQPSWLHPWFRFWLRIQQPRPMFFAYLIAAIETAIAVALIIGFARMVTYSLGLLFSFLVWSVPEGFGGPYGPGATDVGASIMYVLIFGALLLFSRYQGPSPLSVDHRIERHVPWWDRVAEVQPRRYRSSVPGP